MYSIVPVLMATQHPDSASRYIGSRGEVEEAVLDLTPIESGGYGCDEKMVDYEGKLTPYHQVEWVVEALIEAGFAPGRDFLITPRIPSERLEGCVRQVMVLWGVMAANKRSLSLAGSQAIRFIVHPMSASSWELIATQKRILKVQRLAEEELGLRGAEPPCLIPLIEDVVRLINVDHIVSSLYSRLLSEGFVYEGIRVFLGKSDAALAYGHLASSIGLVVGLSRLYKWADREGVRVYPIIGVGKPPFRGHLSPEAVSLFTRQYSGYHTVTIQSALRFDTPRSLYEETIRALRENVAGKPRILGGDEERVLVEAARIAASEYLVVLRELADTVSLVSKAIPKRRDRVSEEVYSRDLSNAAAFTGDRRLIGSPLRLVLPRAIKFTAAMYSIGLPPSLLGLGRGLRALGEKLGDQALDLVVKTLPLLERDVCVDLCYSNLELLESYTSTKVAELVREDINTLRDLLGVECCISVPNDYWDRLWRMRRLVSSGDNTSAQKACSEAAVLRGFLG